jgi:site-specific DNA-adenine methylase
MGSKRKIAKEIVKFIKDRHPNAIYFYDLFGGGGAITLEALNQGFKVIYNEYNSSVFNLFTFIINRVKNNESGDYGFFPNEYYRFIEKDEFDSIVKSNKNDPYSGFVKLFYSFGNDGKNYLFGKNKVEFKKSYHNLVVFNCDKSKLFIENLLNIKLNLLEKGTLREKRLHIRKQLVSVKENRVESLERISRISDLEHLKRNDNLENIFQKTGRLGDLENTTSISTLENVICNNQSFENVICNNQSFENVIINTPLENTIIYCDPPYRNTAGYKHLIDYDKFDKWFKSMNYDAYLSEYNSPHNLLHSIKKRSLLKDNSKLVNENLYYNKEII